MRTTMKKSLRILSLTILVIFLAAPAYAVPLDKMAATVVRQLDRQVAERLGQEKFPAKGVSLFITTPVDLNNLTESNAIARQMQEDITQCFIEMGYSVQEIRKGTSIVFDPVTGETLLTRDVKRLSSTTASSAAIVTGTYTMSGQNIRFNIKLVHTSSLESLAMASITVPLSGELAQLVKGKEGFGIPFEPTVITRLP